MAIFVLIAWTIQLGEVLGLLETESSDPQHIAYRRCHDALVFIRSCLPAHNRVEVQEQCLLWSGGFLALDGHILYCGGRRFDLRARGTVRFSWSGRDRILVEIFAAEGEQQHWLRLTLKAESEQKKDTGERAAAGVPGSGDDAL